MPPVFHTQPTLPLLPYAGSSGWSGTETSEQRATWRDASGLTSKTQAAVYEYVQQCRRFGCTVVDLREDLAGLGHHGTVSAALTALHQGGFIARLSAKRDGCKIYVHPDYIEERAIEAPGRNRPKCDDHHPCSTCGR